MMNTSSHGQSSTAGSVRERELWQHIKLRSPRLEELLHGGIRCGAITEFFGECGSGKTQIVLQLALNVQLPPQDGGLYGVAIYYYCDYVFPLKRLKKIRDAMQRELKVGNDVVDVDNVVLYKVEDCRELCHKLRELRRECLERSDTARHVRLVVIDGIASLFRSQFDNTKDSMSARKTFFRTIRDHLNGYASEFNLAVVITNQVTDVVDGSSMSTGSPALFSMYGQRIQASLGHSWASCISTRIFVGVNTQAERDAQPGQSSRKMKVVFSNYLENNECSFTITRDGVK